MRAERLISLIYALQRGATWTAPELAAELGVSIRTIFRDLDALSALGIPVFTERGRGGGIRLQPQFRRQLAGLSAADAESLALVSMAPGTESRVVDKLRAAVPNIHALAAQRAQNCFLFDPTPWFSRGVSQRYVDELREAVWNDRVVQIDYSNAKPPRRYQLECYGLVAKADVWYLIARRSDGEWRSLRTDRIDQLVVTDQTFTRDPDFELASYWRKFVRGFEANLPNRFWVTVTATDAGLAELRSRYDGWLVPQLEDARAGTPVRLDLQTLDRATRVVMDAGPQLRVLAPAEFREHVVRTGETMIQTVASPA